MDLKDFSYFLPDELIAQHPCQKRDRSRLLFLDKKEEKMADCSFFQLPNFLQQGDVLVVNEKTYRYWSDTPGNVYATARTEGRVLYEQAA